MKTLTAASRLLGRCICTVKGCRYFYPGGCFGNCYCYECVRCGELDCPLESLQCFDPSEDPDFEFSNLNDFEEQRLENARWFAVLPFPRWI